MINREMEIFTRERSTSLVQRDIHRVASCCPFLGIVPCSNGRHGCVLER